MGEREGEREVERERRERKGKKGEKEIGYSVTSRGNKREGRKRRRIWLHPGGEIEKGEKEGIFSNIRRGVKEKREREERKDKFGYIQGRKRERRKKGKFSNIRGEKKIERDKRTTDGFTFTRRNNLKGEKGRGRGRRRGGR